MLDIYIEPFFVTITIKLHILSEICFLTWIGNDHLKSSILSYSLIYILTTLGSLYFTCCITSSSSCGRFSSSWTGLHYICLHSFPKIWDKWNWTSIAFSSCFILTSSANFVKALTIFKEAWHVFNFIISQRYGMMLKGIKWYANRK